MKIQIEKILPKEDAFEKMPAEKFLAELKAELRERPDAIFEKRGELKYDKTYDFVRIVSKDIRPEDKILFIRAGLHGEEIAGSLTMRRHINEVIDYAHQRGVRVIIYPLANPSGFESGERFNIANDEGGKGSEGTDDVIRYELLNGKIVAELEENQPFKQWFLSSSARINIRLPQEAALMHREIRSLPFGQIEAMLDLHQDYITPDLGPAAYHYKLSDNVDPRTYDSIVRSIRSVAPILGNTSISAGFPTPRKSDKRGFITRNDGSLPDLMYRRGVEHSIVVETSGATPLDKADEVNMIWIKGVIDLL